MGPLAVGVIGAGKISEQYLANMAQYPDLDVTFVADLFPDRARAQADAYGVSGAGTVEDALARDDLELIVNLTIPAAHAEVGAAALASGKHVWNEKPIAATRVPRPALVQQAADAGLLVGTAPDTFPRARPADLPKDDRGRRHRQPALRVDRLPVAGPRTGGTTILNSSTRPVAARCSTCRPTT